MRTALVLSEAQAAIVERLHQTYLEAWNARIQQDLPGISRDGVEAAKLFLTPNGVFDMAAVDAFAGIECRRVTLIESLVALENVLNRVFELRGLHAGILD